MQPGHLNRPEFVARFPENLEIGRNLDDETLSIYYDNGSECGVWRKSRRTTLGEGEVLNALHSACCREWCRRLRQEKGRSR